MCAACRTKRPAHELVRFVLADSTLMVDLDRALPGRGVHLCAQPRCLRQAVKRQVFRRGFSTSVDLGGAGGSAGPDPATRLRGLVVTALTEAASGLLLKGERAHASGHPTAEVEVTWLAEHGSTPSTHGRGRVAHRYGARLSWLEASANRFTLEGSGGIARRPKSPTPGQANNRNE